MLGRNRGDRGGERIAARRPMMTRRRRWLGLGFGVRDLGSELGLAKPNPHPHPPNLGRAGDAHARPVAKGHLVGK